MSLPVGVAVIARPSRPGVPDTCVNKLPVWLPWTGARGVRRRALPPRASRRRRPGPVAAAEPDADATARPEPSGRRARRPGRHVGRPTPTVAAHEASPLSPRRRRARRPRPRVRADGEGCRYGWSGCVPSACRRRRTGVAVCSRGPGGRSVHDGATRAPGRSWSGEAGAADLKPEEMAMMDETFESIEESAAGLTWTVREPIARSSHALVDGGRVWLVDPTWGPPITKRVAALGEPAGVIQLLDRHNRDCVTVAAQLGVPHHRVPASLPTRRSGSSLWSISASGARSLSGGPTRGTLVVAEAVGTSAGYAPGPAGAGVSIGLRLWPPRPLVAYEPEHLLVGHGPALHGPRAAAALPRGDGALAPRPSSRGGHTAATVPRAGSLIGHTRVRCRTVGRRGRPPCRPPVSGETRVMWLLLRFPRHAHPACLGGNGPSLDTHRQWEQIRKDGVTTYRLGPRGRLTAICRSLRWR